MLSAAVPFSQQATLHYNQTYRNKMLGFVSQMTISIYLFCEIYFIKFWVTWLHSSIFGSHGSVFYIRILLTWYLSSGLGSPDYLSIGIWLTCYFSILIWVTWYCLSGFDYLFTCLLDFFWLRLYYLFGFGSADIVLHSDFAHLVFSIQI